MYSSSSDLTTIMIRRMFSSWSKDVDVGGFGDGDNYDEKEYYDGIGDCDNNEKTQNNIMTMLMVMEEVVGSEARLNPE